MSAPRSYGTIHVARRQRGLTDDDVWRDFLERETGKRSLRAMSGHELKQVQIALTPGDVRTGHRGKKLTGPYAKILQALWISGWNLGVVRDKSDQALMAFIKRQTGIEATAFLRDHSDATSAIEALKDWLTREAGVDWTVDRNLAWWTQENGYRIAIAQLAKLRASDPAYEEFITISHWLIRAGLPAADRIDAEGWRTAMNSLGALIRGDV